MKNQISLMISMFNWIYRMKPKWIPNVLNLWSNHLSKRWQWINLEIKSCSNELFIILNALYMNCTLNLLRHVLSSAPNPYITMLVSEKIQFAFEMYLHFSMSCLNFLFIPPSSFILFQPHTRKNVYRNFLKAMNLENITISTI